MKGGINFTGRYFRVRLRSSGKTRIGLREYPGGASVKGTYGTCSEERKNTRFPEPGGNFALFI
jgi:hypothetical protein